MMKSIIVIAVCAAIFTFTNTPLAGTSDGIMTLEVSLSETVWSITGDTLTKIIFGKAIHQSNEKEFRWPNIVMKKDVGLKINTESLKSQVLSTYKNYNEEGYFCLYSKDSAEIFIREQDYDYYYVGRIKQLSKSKMEFSGVACELASDFYTEKITFKPYRKAKMIFKRK